MARTQKILCVVYWYINIFEIEVCDNRNTHGEKNIDALIGNVTSFKLSHD